MKAKRVILSYWYNVHNESISGYELSDYETGIEFFSGTETECLKYASDNNMTVCE